MGAITRREFIGAGATAAGGTFFRSSVRATEAVSPGRGNTAFQPLRLGEIRPAGWLHRQLRLQADGLGGHLDEFWPDVDASSGWLGGAGESWERGPYFVDGLLPLGWLLGDDVLKAKAMRFISWTLDHQQANGMIGPSANDDWWPRMVMLKVLAQYYEVSSDARVIAVMTRYFHYQLAALPGRPLRDWGKYRWPDEALIVAWLHERTGDPELLKLAELLKAQGHDWVRQFRDFKHTGVTSRAFLDEAAVGGNKPDGMETHGDNNGQALKTAAVQSRLGGDPALERTNFFRQMDALDRFHGLPNGIFSCDEHLAGRDPSHGSELCTVVETLFSLETALAAFGDAGIADRIEKIAYNALPGAFDDSMWAHQYNQQPNQIQVSLNSKPWTTDGPESNLYGLEPNFGCCTANFHQGWPKLTAHLWMRSPDEGLVAAIYAPCHVVSKVKNVTVALAVETDYPFKESVRIGVGPEKPLRFPMRLRIPGWAKRATVQVNGRAVEQVLRPESFAVIDRVWSAGDVISLVLPMAPVATRGFNDSLSLSRGPLVFSLDPGESWVKLRDRGMTADWQVFPLGSWNYALDAGGTLAQVGVVEGDVGERPFAARDTAVRLRVKGRRLDAWRSEDGVASAPPKGQQTSSLREEVLELIPYGAAKLRVTAFPQLSGAVPPVETKGRIQAVSPINVQPVWRSVS